MGTGSGQYGVRGVVGERHDRMNAAEFGGAIEHRYTLLMTDQRHIVSRLRDD